MTELDELLSAARAVLAERSYEGLRVEDVLHRAGLSTRAFYR
ncbi:MAG: Bacterial regulatory protein tetR family, partial [Acidimicrobiaceae bacterium]